MATVTKNKSGSWKGEARLTRGGVVVFRDTRTFDTKQEALTWAKETEARARGVFTTGKAMPTRMTLREAVEAWEEDVKTYIKSASEATQKNTRFQAFTKSVEKGKTHRKLWKASALADKPLSTISQADIEHFIDDRRDDERSDSTIRNNLHCLNQLYQHAAAGTRPDRPAGWKWQIHSPVAAASKARELRSSGQRNRRLMPSELDLILRTFENMKQAQIRAPEKEGRQFIDVKVPSNKKILSFEADDSLIYIRAAFEAAIETALRKEKLFKICWRWVDLTPGQERIIFPAEEWGSANKGVPKILSMSLRMVEIIKEIKQIKQNINLDEPIFHPLKPARVWRLLNFACEALDIEDFRWHDLRHEACSRLAERGWTAIEIQAVSGHKTLASLQRYIHVDQRAIYRKMREAA
ncbi:tyrosine-type recombinase/integrase [Achromobacter sp. F4_2707]|uniref:tyrosine-type recombinase/integrase n=1 Tax=Achromobacter sp. F4_2707 TaxID=3114286 RepID=UPI0039C68040